MNQLTTLQYAWAIYFAGSLGCTIAAWWMFLWAWRFVRYAAVVTVMTLLFTPFAIDAQTMTMAPAIYTLVFEGVSRGPQAIMPLIKVMAGIWLIGIILVTVYIVLTRHRGETIPSSGEKKLARKASRRQDYAGNVRYKETRRPSSRGLSRDEYQAREELLKGEIPIRAIRD